MLAIAGDHVVELFHAPAAAGDETHEEVPETDLNPIAPELKEITWGFGAFIVLAVLMRWFLYPRLHKGIVARNELIRSGHEEGERIAAAAVGDANAYEAQLASVRAEAGARIDAARATLEQERAERLAEVNARIAARRAEVAAEVERAREAAQGSVEMAVRDVAGAAGRLATGREPDQNVVADAVSAVMSGVSR